MPPTLKDFMKTVRETDRDVQRVNTELLKVAAVRATELTGHPGWDRFLQQCQVDLDEAEVELRAWVEKCVSAYKDEDMRFAQRQVTHYEAVRTYILKLMDRPQEILEEYQEQRETVE